MLGLLEWPGEVGLAGHSDADVVAHAICDALLSAANLGDLGSNFGVDKAEYASASGAVFLKETFAKITEKHWEIANLSVQVIGNRPNISSRRDEIQNAISAVLGGASISVSGTTTDGLGLTGRGEGIAAIATCLLNAKN
jgi:2-C-methyl-D-erythritol 2,4-cyclodiphosphate synthase